MGHPLGDGKSHHAALGYHSHIKDDMSPMGVKLRKTEVEQTCYKSFTGFSPRLLHTFRCGGSLGLRRFLQIWIQFIRPSGNGKTKYTTLVSNK